MDYHLTLSNGRGPVEQYQDYDNNKAIGGRLYLRGYWLGDLTIGASGYGGTVTDARQEIDVATQSVKWFNFEHYRELALAADVRWLWNSIHFQAEAAVHQKVWDDGARPPISDFDNNVIGSQPDVRRIGWYALLGYRLPWFNIMPYLMYTYYDTDERAVLIGASKVEELAGGLNIRVTPRVVLKGEWGRAIFLSPLIGNAERRLARLPQRSGRLGLLIMLRRWPSSFASIRRVLTTAAVAVALSLAAGAGAPRAAAPPSSTELLVVVGAQSPLHDISRSALRRAYLGEVTEDHGVRLVPPQPPAGRARARGFRSGALGIGARRDPRASGLDQRIRGQGSAPRAIPTVPLLLRVLAQLPGGISYLRRSDLPANSTAGQACSLSSGKKLGAAGYLFP